MNTKPLRLGLAVLFVLSYNCFFDFSGPWDWRCSSVKTMCY